MGKQPTGHSVLTSSSRSSLSTPIIFATTTALLVALYSWPRRWLLSGTPILQFCILLGSSEGTRVLPFIHLWPLSTTLNLIYAISSTSWLLYWVFTALCYPAIFLTCLFQFHFVSNFARRILRNVLKQLHFIDDKIAFFDIPALEIDTEVDGLMVLRGITFSLSSLSFVVHGVEVGIKLSDDMELAIQTERVEVKLFRGIEVGDCFANLKGGTYEMTFGEMDAKTEDADGDQVFVEGTPLLTAASRASTEISREPSGGEKTMKMTEKLTDGHVPEDSSASEGLQDMETLSPDNEAASGRYKQMLKEIAETSAIDTCRKHVQHATTATGKSMKDDQNALRAAICSHLHSTPSVPHPPSRSIKVTTLQNLAPPRIRAFLHRLPMLLRLLLNPLSYFHPVTISSITATASGRWIDNLLVQKIFQSYADEDREIRSLKDRINAWLSDANFALELGPLLGLAQVPLTSSYDITCTLRFEDVMAYRALPRRVALTQVVRLGGADATFGVPSFLLPHHEHLLPPVPTQDAKHKLEQEVEDADGTPKTVQAERELEQVEKDEANVKIAVHVRMPACLDQELLDFVAALVKATKVVELEKADDPMDVEVTGIRDFGMFSFSSSFSPLCICRLEDYR
jgi:hypothetical protein